MKSVIIACPECGARRIGKTWICFGDEGFKSIGGSEMDDVLIEEYCPKHPSGIEVSVEFASEEELREFRLFDIIRRKL